MSNEITELKKQVNEIKQGGAANRAASVPVGKGRGKSSLLAAAFGDEFFDITVRGWPKGTKTKLINNHLNTIFGAIQAHATAVPHYYGYPD